MTARSDDSLFSSDLRALTTQRPRLAANLMLVALALLVATALIWAAFSQVDEVTRGQGRIIPSGQVQIVQNLEGGIVGEILVRVGQIVEPGDVLVRIDDTNFASTFRENVVRRDSLIARIARLQGEADGKDPVYPADLPVTHPAVAPEIDLYRARRTELQSTIDVLRRQMEQRQQEILELTNRTAKLQESLTLAREELGILRPMVERGVSSRVELLRVQRQVTDLERDQEAARLAMPRVQSTLAETRRRIEERQATFQSAAQNELTDARMRLNALNESIGAVADRVRRTEVRAPVRGTVKQIKVNTVGGVIQPGMDLVEIVPLEESLLVEASIRPQDIAFLRPGQDAKVKVTAYDFALYGMLDGKLEHISADAIADPQQQGQSFFQIRVRTARSSLGSPEKPLPIIPGMMAEVDILTGKRTVLDYFLKPVIRARERALTER